MSSASSHLDSLTAFPPPPPPSPPPLPPVPPPAPPLPPQRYGQRAATAIARLAHPFIYSSRPPSPQGHRDGDPGPTTFRHSVARHSSPLPSKSTAHKTGIPIAALDISGDRTHAILAGRDILKTIRVNDGYCTEDFNLRSTISTYASAHNASRDAVSAQHRDQLAAYDVKWSRGNFSSTIATAAASGRIVVYDVNRPSVEIARLHEHTRQVHRLAFNPYQGALLISGSQDGTVRMWDMRDLRGERSTRVTGSIKRFFGNSDGVRDLRWSPTDGVEFATGTDSGAVQRWDFRKENAPILKINAHDKTCLSIDWHPSGRYLASGGADKNIKVWDFKSTDRRMKPSWLLRAPQAVSIVRWRPVPQPPGENSLDTRQSTYLASSYDGKDPRIHVWDFRRPLIPFQEHDKYDSPATDMLWHSEDLLWTVGSAGIFTQTDMNFSPKPIDRQAVNVLTTAPNGEFCYFADSRPKRRISLAEAEEHFLCRVNTDGSSGEKLSGSHSATDGSLEETSVLSNSLKKNRPKAANPRYSTAMLANSGQSLETRVVDVNTLDPIYRSTQTASYGYVLGVFDADSFKYLARNYILPSSTTFTNFASAGDEIGSSFETNANLAAQTGQYRLAQTWRILGRAANKEIGIMKENLRNASATRFKLSRPDDTSGEHPALSRGPKAGNPREATKTLLSTLSHAESSSNMQTPIAKPAQDLPFVPSSTENLLDQERGDQTISFIDPARYARGNPALLNTSYKVPAQAQGASPREDISGFDDRSIFDDSPITQHYSPSFGDFPDIERQMQERRSAMSNYRAKPRAVFRLDDNPERAQSLNVLPRLDRHDSSESLQMFSASSDSEPRSLMLAGSFEESQRSNLSDFAFENAGTSATQELTYSDPRQEPTNPRKGNPKKFTEISGSQVVPILSFPLNEVDRLGNAVTYSPVRRPSEVLPPMVHVSETLLRKRRLSEDIPSILLTLQSTSSPQENSLAELPLPWSLASLLPSILAYHLSAISDPQFPSLLMLFLAPLFPTLFGSPYLRTPCLLAYHSHLDALRLYPEAARFRKACHVGFPEIAAAAAQGPSRVGFWCENCGKPVKGDLDGWCARCCEEWGPCSICELQDPPPDAWLAMHDTSSSFTSKSEVSQSSSPIGTRLWAWCQGCGHGGHSSCLRVWWQGARSGLKVSDGGKSNEGTEDGDISEGACPVLGCGHDCIPGQQRDACMRQLDRERRRGRANVLRDDWVAGESRAVERTRGMVGVGRGSGGGTSDGFFPEGKLLGLAGRRVRLAAAPEEEVLVLDETNTVRYGKNVGERGVDKEEQLGGGADL